LLSSSPYFHLVLSSAGLATHPSAFVYHAIASRYA
jgi:hypothetical protein